MLLTKRSMLTGKENTMDIPVSGEEYRKYLEVKHQVCIQNFFPTLTLDQREFLLTGATSDEWDQAFSEVEDDVSDDEPAF